MATCLGAHSQQTWELELRPQVHLTPWTPVPFPLFFQEYSKKGPALYCLCSAAQSDFSLVLLAFSHKHMKVRTCSISHMGNQRPREGERHAQGLELESLTSPVREALWRQSCRSRLQLAGLCSGQRQEGEVIALSG